jgi:hypothetical protein
MMLPVVMDVSGSLGRPYRIGAAAEVEPLQSPDMC